MKNLLTFMLPLLFIILGCQQKNKKFDEIKFNSEEWLQGDRVIRGKMVDNLIEDGFLNGKSKSEVFGLLGAPTASDTTNHFVYQVDLGKKTGPLGIGGIWLFFLTVEFDTLSNKAINVRCND